MTLVDNPPGTFGCDAFPEHPEFKADFDSGSEANNQFNAGAILSNIDQLRDAGRSLIAAALHAEPGVPVGYRYLAWSYGDDKSRSEGEMLAEAGRCLTRAISISCGDRGGITDLAYGAEALSQIFDQYKLRFQQAILHGQLGHELLDPARQPAGIEERRRVELRRRGAEALAFAAHYLRLSADCTSGAPAKACAVIPALVRHRRQDVRGRPGRHRNGTVSRRHLDRTRLWRGHVRLVLGTGSRLPRGGPQIHQLTMP